MTHIVSGYTRGIAFHVSDRLVTVRMRDGSYREFDPLANKTIVYMARDALVSVGYSGLAYLEDRPFDQWLAEVLVNRDLSTTGFMNGGIANDDWLNLFLSSVLICKELERAFRDLPERDVQPQTIAISGVQIRRKKHQRPLLWIIQNRNDDLRRFGVGFLDTDTFRWDREFHLLFIGALDDRAEEWTRQQLRSRVISSPEAFEDILVDGLRRVRTRDSVVGHDCMAVRVRLDGVPQIVVRYHPAHTRRVTLTRGHQTHDVPAAFSPWLLTPGGVIAPSMMGGRAGSGWNLSLGGLEAIVSVSQDVPDPSLYAFATSQPRRNWPPP